MPSRPVPLRAPHVDARPTTAATYRRRRAVALCVLALLGVGVQVAALQVVHAGGATRTTAVAEPIASTPPPVAAASAPAATPPRVYTVRAGDTLWSIARQLQPEGDVRPLVDALAERAGSSAIRAGQRLDLDGLGR